MSLRIALLVLLPSVAFAQRPVIEISGANFRPMPLALAAPQTQDDGAKTATAEFDAALSFDFAACGLFQLLDRKGFLADAKEGVTASTIQFSRWTDVGAESLVKTQLSSEGGNLHGDLRLFNVAAGREELKVSESVPGNNPRHLAHKLASVLGALPAAQPVGRAA